MTAPRRGRPPISDDGERMVTVAIWMRPDMRDALRRAAQAEDRSMASLVRRILAGAEELEDYL